MSGLAGVMWYGGRPAELHDAARLLASLSHRRGRPTWVVQGSAAVACLAETSEEPLLNREESRDKPIVVMIDGQIHNAEDLARLLGLDRGTSDRSIVERAWRKWGRNCPAHLIGDFALTILDGDRLFAARDCAPFRPFYYRPTARGCYWASEIAALVHHDRPRLNEGMVAEYLADRIVTATETLFDGVFRLPPAYAMETSAGGDIQIWRYWHPDPRAEIRYRDQREYDEHFRALFREAVGCRLPSSGRVALWYSGGIDSSAVAAQAAGLRDAGAPFARDIETVSITASGYAVDEAPCFTAGAAHFRFPSTVRPFYFGTAGDFEQDAAISCDIPPTPSMMGGRRGWEALAERHVDTCLTGLGGDDWLVGSEFVLLDDIRGFRWGSAVARLRAERDVPFGFSVNQLLRLGAWLHLPPRGRALARKAFGLRATPAHVAQTLASRVSLDDRLRNKPSPPPFPTFAQRLLYEAATGASVVVSLETYARMAARWKVDARHPFEDRRLAEFALSLPPDQLLRPGVPRHIVVSAMLRDLPRAIYNRVDGVDYAPVMRDLLRRLHVRRCVETAISDLPDWLEPSPLREMATQIEASNAEGIGRQMWAIWQMLAIHAWWTGVQQSKPPTTTLSTREIFDGQAALSLP